MMARIKKPALACDVDLDKVVYPVWGFPKIDGVRIINLIGHATARTLKPHKNIYTTTKFSDPIYAGIDGEASVGDIRSNSLCRDTSSALSTIEGKPNVILNAFDYLTDDTIGLVYANRYKALREYIDRVKPPDVRLIEFEVIDNEEQLFAFYKRQLSLGYEGAVYRDPYGLHKDGRCTANEGFYLRMKPSSDKEALVLEIIEAQANLNEKKINALGLSERSSHKANKVGKDMVGMLCCKDLISGDIINIGPGKMTHAERIYFWNHPEEIINHYIKYKSMDNGIKSLPRFARYICLRSEEDII